jgi:hypothetical protein
MLGLLIGVAVILVATSTESQCRIDCYRVSHENFLRSFVSNYTDVSRVDSIHKNPSIHHANDIMGPNHQHKTELHFIESCQLGCSMFFSSFVSPMTLSHCFDSCGRIYFYNSSINEYDRAAILECMNGCWMATKLCQPGYFCVHNGTDDDSASMENKIHNHEWMNFSGYMLPCPRGTFRTIDSTSVSLCDPCPPGRYRNDIMGTSIDSCIKCPPNTFASQSGSTSITDCLTCPTGTFAQEYGSSTCKCITPSSCEHNTNPSIR